MTSSHLSGGGLTVDGRRRLAAALAAAVLLPVSVGVPALTQAGGAQAATACSSNPATTIAAMRPGGVWNGSGHCYTTNANGIRVPSGVTVENATIVDRAAAAPLAAALQVFNADGVTLKNLTIVGRNTAGTFYSRRVDGAAIDDRSSSNLTILNVKTYDTFGDGLTLFWSDQRRGQDANVYVDGLTVTNAGRSGFTPTTVTGLVVKHLDVVSSHSPAIDFESGLPGVGITGYNKIVDSRWNGSLFAQEYAAPGSFLEFANDQAAATAGSAVLYDSMNGGHTQWDGGSMSLPANTHGFLRAPIMVYGTKLVLRNVHVTRAPFNRSGQSPTAFVDVGIRQSAHTPGILELQGTALPPPGPHVGPGSQIITQP